MKTPNILYIASGSLWAGAEMQIYTLLDAGKENSHITAVVFNEGSLAERLRASGIDVHLIDETKHSFFQMLRQLYRLLTDLNVDLIHTHGYKENVIGSIVGLFSGVPSIRTIHGDNEFKVRFWQLKKSIPAAINLISGRFLQKKIISVSEELASKLVRKYSQQKIVVIPNGLNIEKVELSSNKVIELPGNKTSFKIVFVGRLVALKRVDLILESYAILYKGFGLDYELYIVGDGLEKESLVNQVNGLGISQGVHFLGHREDIYAIMRSMNCLIMTSDHEGLPMTVLEAIALRLPIVSHAVGDIPKVLDDGKNGYLVYEQKPEKFADAIQQCRKELNSNITEKAYTFIQQNYSHDKNAKAHLKVYNQVIN